MTPPDSSWTPFWMLGKPKSSSQPSGDLVRVIMLLTLRGSPASSAAGQVWGNQPLHMPLHTSLDNPSRYSGAVWILNVGMAIIEAWAECAMLLHTLAQSCTFLHTLAHSYIFLYMFLFTQPQEANCTELLSHSITVSPRHSRGVTAFFKDAQKANAIVVLDGADILLGNIASESMGKQL